MVFPLRAPPKTTPPPSSGFRYSVPRCAPSTWPTGTVCARVPSDSFQGLVGSMWDGWALRNQPQALSSSQAPATAACVQSMGPRSLTWHAGRTGRPLGLCVALGVTSEKQQPLWALLTCQGTFLAHSWVG